MNRKKEKRKKKAQHCSYERGKQGCSEGVVPGSLQNTTIGPRTENTGEKPKGRKEIEREVGRTTQLIPQKKRGKKESQPVCVLYEGN